MSRNILNKIVAAKMEEVARKRKILPLGRVTPRLDDVQPPRDFKREVFEDDAISIIAEIKRASPSAGILRGDLNPSLLARVYEENGASAVSVLIDREFFRGSLEDLSEVRKAVSLPLLAKEFIVDPYQIYEARLWGADAVLLIARLLDEKRLFDFHQLAQDLQMACIVEVHSPEDVEKLQIFPSPVVVGINNRNLENFQVDLATTEQFLKLIPPFHLIVSESGIRDYRDIRRLKTKGVRAFLVGETLLRSNDPARTLKELRHG